MDEPKKTWPWTARAEARAPTPDPPPTSTLDELRRDGVLQRFGERYETTRRWRAARHRASSAPDPASDRIELRNPIVQGLIGFYGDRRALATFAPYVAVLFALESSERVSHSTPVRK